MCDLCVDKNLVDKNLVTIECIGALLEFNEIEKKVFAFPVYRALVTFHNKGSIL